MQNQKRGSWVGWGSFSGRSYAIAINIWSRSRNGSQNLNAWFQLGDATVSTGIVHLGHSSVLFSFSQTYLTYLKGIRCIQNKIIALE